MKKLLFVLAFAFIGQQAFSQMYIVTLSNSVNHDVCFNAQSNSPVLSIVAPNGAITYNCLTGTSISNNSNLIGIINQELNNIINQGYKLIETNNGYTRSFNSDFMGNGFIGETSINYGTTWYLAIP